MLGTQLLRDALMDTLMVEDHGPSGLSGCGN